MKDIIKNILLVLVIFLASCFLTGILLANTSQSVSHLNRISGLWSGQLVGYTSLYSNIFGYNISTAESNDPWARVYIAIIPNARHIQASAPNDALLNGITKTVEAMAISTAASVFGDIPYSEVNSEIEDSSRDLSEDIYFEGDADKWIAAANTVKARIYMWMRDYSNAYQSAQSGIASADDNLQHIPRGDAAVNDGDKNLFYEPIAGSRAGDIGSRDSYMLGLLDIDSPTYRGNAKTDETSRLGYYTILESSASENLGFANQFEPQDIVSFQENQLILAEAGARVIDFDRGLQHLNDSECLCLLMMLED